MSKFNQAMQFGVESEFLVAAGNFFKYSKKDTPPVRQFYEKHLPALEGLAIRSLPSASGFKEYTKFQFIEGYANMFETEGWVQVAYHDFHLTDWTRQNDSHLFTHLSRLVPFVTSTYDLFCLSHEI